MTYLASALKEGQNVNLTFESQNADHLYRLLQCLINIIVIRIETLIILKVIYIDPVLNDYYYLEYNLVEITILKYLKKN